MKMIVKLGALTGLLMAAIAHAGPVNINTADEKTLEKELKGVGPAKAAAIVKDREENGPFSKPSDITRVGGVGQSIFDQNKDDIKVKD